MPWWSIRTVYLHDPGDDVQYFYAPEPDHQRECHGGGRPVSEAERA